MRSVQIAAIVALLSAIGCNSPKPFELKDVCGQPEGSSVIVQGFLALPTTIDTIQLKKGGSITAVGYKLLLTSKAGGSGDVVKSLIWTTNNGEPNKVKAISSGFSPNDLIVYRDDGKESAPGKIVTVTGETSPDNEAGCVISVRKIEQR